MSDLPCHPASAARTALRRALLLLALCSLSANGPALAADPPVSLTSWATDRPLPLCANDISSPADVSSPEYHELWRTGPHVAETPFESATEVGPTVPPSFAFSTFDAAWQTPQPAFADPAQEPWAQQSWAQQPWQTPDVHAAFSGSPESRPLEESGFPTDELTLADLWADFRPDLRPGFAAGETGSFSVRTPSVTDPIDTGDRFPSFTLADRFTLSDRFALADAVVRGQQPEIQLLTLDGDNSADIEQTSLLGTVTGSSGRFRGDYLTDFGDTSRIGMQTLSLSKLGFGIDAEANYWQRPKPGLGREALWTGDVNMIYSFPFHPRMNFRSGIGPNFRIDGSKTRVGYNITHGIDVYLLWRFMVTGEVDWGKIRSDDLFRYRLALGLTWSSFEFYSGYESYKLGGEHLDGWINGVALWY